MIKTARRDSFQRFVPRRLAQGQPAALDFRHAATRVMMMARTTPTGGTTMSQENFHFPPLSEIDHVTAAAGALTQTGVDTGFFIFDVIRQAVTLSSEMIWPAVREIGEDLREHPLVVDGWTFRPVDFGGRWSVSFVASNPDLPGGYLFSVAIDPEKTPEASERYAEIIRGLLRSVKDIEDPDERKMAQVKVFADRSPELDAIYSDPDNFRPPRRLPRRAGDVRLGLRRRAWRQALRHGRQRVPNAGGAS